MSSAGGNSIGFTPTTLTAGTYTIYLRGTAAVTNQVTSAIRFSAATAAVPKPATWAMMLLGVGMIGGGLRARRRSVAFA